MTTLTARTQGERRTRGGHHRAACREAPGHRGDDAIIELTGCPGSEPPGDCHIQPGQKGLERTLCILPSAPHSDPSSPLICNPILDKFLLSGALSPGTWPGDPSKRGRGYGGGD